MRRLLPLVIALAACGKVHNLTDAGGGDGMGADSNTAIDAPGPDADPHGAITVLVNQPSGPATPQAGVPVVFVNPDGTIVAEVATGSDGKATATVLPGATVTAVYNAGTTSVQLETVREVAPGDTIVIGPLYGQGSGSGGTFTGNVPDLAGSQSYDLYGPCGGGNSVAAGSGAPTPVTISISDTCKQATMDLLAIARNSDKTPTAWAEQKGVTYTDGGSVDLTGPWGPFLQVTATFQNPPSAVDANLIYVSRRAPDANGFEEAGYAQGGTITLAVPGAATAFVESNFNSAAGGGQQQMYEVVDGTSLDYTVDLSTALLPFIPFPTFDPATGTATTGVDAGGDVYALTVSFSRIVNATTYSYQWDVWTPAHAEIALPPMPTDLAETSPAAGDAVNSAYAGLYDLSTVTDWAAIRGQLFGAFDAYYAGRSTIASGRLVWSFPVGVGFTGPRAPLRHR